MSQHRTRETPIQLIAHLLPDDHPLRSPVPERMRVLLSSPPSQLLQQLEDPGWPPLSETPTFPPDYPPDLPRFQNVQLLAMAFSTSQNKRLEWVGDALVAAAIADCVHRHVPDVKKRITDDIVDLLASKYYLGHLALLYGLQLHCSVSDPLHRVRTPGAIRMSDVFEAFVASAAEEFGGERALEWLRAVFDPWVASLCEKGRGLASQDISPSTQSRYQQYILHNNPGETTALSWPALTHGVLAAFGPNRTGFSSDAGDARRSLNCTPAGWEELDLTRVDVPDDYPPLPPVFHAADASALTAALTDVYCRLHFGEHILTNHRYQWLGQHLCLAAISTIASRRLPSASACQLHNIRTECTYAPLLGRLGLLLKLDQHIITIQRLAEAGRTIGLARVEGSLRALIGAVYQQFGWTALLDWLDPLFSPWIMAAWHGTLRVSEAAQTQRDVHHQHLDAKRRRAQQKREHPCRQNLGARDGTLRVSEAAQTQRDVHNQHLDAKRRRAQKKRENPCRQNLGAREAQVMSTKVRERYTTHIPGSYKRR